MIEVICLALMLVGVTLYAVLGGADFGAGIWDLTAGTAAGGARMRGVIERSMGPVWEANHVWLIFVLVVAWTAFPTFFGSMMSSLWIPMSIAAFGIILRGAAFALRGQAATLNEARTLGAIFALSSLLVPFAFGTVAGAIASGHVAYGNAEIDPWDAFLNPFSIYVGVLAVVFSAYMAAIFLIGDSERMKASDVQSAFRKRALASGTLAGLLSIGGLIVARSQAAYLYDGLTSGLGLLCVVASALFGAATLYMVFNGATQWPRITAAAAVGSVTAGWGFAQAPYLFPPGASGSTLKLADAAGNSTTLWWLLIAVIFALCIIVPSLYWLYTLTLKGDMNPTYGDYEDLAKPDKGVKIIP
jgi:cytochrome d ubiquinol oxidase subunit II